MKAVLVIDVPVLDDGRHLCKECPIWNSERLFCEYDFNTKARGCPLKPMPDKKGHLDCEGCNHIECEYAEGWNDCLEEIEK